MKVLVAGGGTAGLISAMILKKHLDIEVSVVHSRSIGIVGVGEGSTEHFSEFMRFVGLDSKKLIKEADATYKSGIMFEGWADAPYLHNVSSDFNLKDGQYNFLYAHQIGNNLDYLNSRIVWENKVEKFYINQEPKVPHNQFHFNTFKLNQVLTDCAVEMGITFFEDEIDDVVFSENGYIKELVGKNQNYQYDFYIDSTGFAKVLIGKMNSKWRSFSDYLKMKAAVVFQTEDTDNYNIWTLAKTMNAGWMFTIPVWGRHGNGYIYDSDYITVDEAKEEVTNLLGRELTFGKEFTFNSGVQEEVWIKNCVAVGLSAMFVEPLEASSIGTTIQQTFMLMHRIIGYDDKVIKQYNKDFTGLADNIRDFIALHYITNRDDTPFWKDMSKVELPESLQNNLDIWKKRIPIREDFNGITSYSLFKEDNFTLVLDGLGLFDREAILHEYAMHRAEVKHDVPFILQKLENLDKFTKTCTHKEFLYTVRQFL